MNLIVAVDKNWAIGNKGNLLVRIPADQKMFRDETMGKVIVMGRKTLESLPGGQPLHGRTNVVLTKNENYTKKGCEVFHSVEETLEFLKLSARMLNSLSPVSIVFFTNESLQHSEKGVPISCFTSGFSSILAADLFAN